MFLVLRFPSLRHQSCTLSYHRSPNAYNFLLTFACNRVLHFLPNAAAGDGVPPTTTSASSLASLEEGALLSQQGSARALTRPSAKTLTDTLTPFNSFFTLNNLSYLPGWAAAASTPAAGHWVFSLRGN